jgi:hypothetical protein
MTKSRTIIASILLMASAILIQFLLAQGNAKIEYGLIRFFSCLVFGAGIVIFLQPIFKRKTSNDK